MKQLTFFFLSIITASSYGQDRHITPSTHASRIQIGASFSPDLCYRTLKATDGSETSEAVVHSRNDMESIKLGFTSGINLCINLKKSISLESGIQYSSKGYQIIAEPNNLPFHKLRLVDNFDYLEIPLGANIILGNKRVRFCGSFGVTTNILIRSTIARIYAYPNNTERKTTPASYDFTRINISPFISMGVDYQIRDRVHLRIQPMLRYGVRKILDAPVTGYLYNGGLNIGGYFSI